MKYLPAFMPALTLALCMIMVGFGVSSCYYDNEEELYPFIDDSTSCNLTNVTYSGDIKNIIDQRCVECHGSDPEPGAKPLHTYNDLKIYLDGSKNVFITSIDHTYDSAPMPEGEPKLPDCEINKLKTWINNGYPNN